MPVIDRLPIAVDRRQIPPADPSPGPEEHTVDHHAVIPPPPALPRMLRKQRRQALPFRNRQIVPLQTLFIHAGVLLQHRIKIHGTRPSSTLLSWCEGGGEP